MKPKQVLIILFLFLSLTVIYFIHTTRNIDIEKNQTGYNQTITDNLPDILIYPEIGYPVFNKGYNKQSHLPISVPAGEWSRGENGLPWFNQELNIYIDNEGTIKRISDANISLYKEDKLIYTVTATLGQTPFERHYPISSQYDETYQLKLVVSTGNYSVSDITNIRPPWSTISNPDYDNSGIINKKWPLKSTLPLFITVGSEATRQITKDESFSSTSEVVAWVNTTILLTVEDDGKWLLSHEVIEENAADPSDAAILLCTLINECGFESTAYVVWGQNEDQETGTYTLFEEVSGWYLVKVASNGLQTYSFSSKQEAVDSLAAEFVSARLFNHVSWEEISLR